MKVGDTAPDFTLVDARNGSKVTLSSLRGRKVVLSFYRYAGCPFCNLRVAQMRKKYTERGWSSSLEILAVFHSPVETMKKRFGSKDDAMVFPFPLLADPEEDIYEMYTVKSSIIGYLFAIFFCWPKLWYAMGKGWCPGNPDSNAFTLPADFLIDENGTIVDTFFAKTIDQHMPVQRIEDFAKKESSSAEP